MKLRATSCKTQQEKNGLRIGSQQEIIFIFHIFFFDFIIENHVREKVSQIEKITKQEKNY